MLSVEDPDPEIRSRCLKIREVLSKGPSMALLREKLNKPIGRFDDSNIASRQILQRLSEASTVEIEIDPKVQPMLERIPFLIFKDSVGDHSLAMLLDNFCVVIGCEWRPVDGKVLLVEKGAAPEGGAEAIDVGGPGREEAYEITPEQQADYAKHFMDKYWQQGNYKVPPNGGIQIVRLDAKRRLTNTD